MFAAVVTAGAVRSRRDLDKDYEYGFAPEKNESGGMSPSEVGRVSKRTKLMSVLDREILKSQLILRR